MTEDLDKLSTEELGKLFPIKISEHNPDWKNQFMSENKLSRKLLESRTYLGLNTLGVLQYLDCGIEQINTRDL